MPDFADSTRLPAHAAQQTLGMLARELARLDERLGVLAENVTPDPAAVLPAELMAGVARVRSDLLSDAISTLSALAVLTEDTALERRVEVAATVDQIAAFG